MYYPYVFHFIANSFHGKTDFKFWILIILRSAQGLGLWGNSLIIHLDRATGAWFWNFHFSIAKITYKFVCQQFSYEVPCHNIAVFATTRNGSDCNNDCNIYLDNLWRCGSLHALFLSFWTKICLIRLWPCYIIGFCSFNVWSVSIDKDCQLDSSVLEENHIYICFFFKWKFFGNWDQYLTRAMHTKVKFHESRRLGFFDASFFLPLISNSFFLGKTDSYRKLLFSTILKL